MTGAEGRAEQRLAGKPPGDPTPPSNPVKDAFTAAMGDYERLLTEVEVVEFSMLGMKPGLRTGYLFNVLTEDFTPEHMQQDPRFARLSEGAAVAMDQSRGYIPLRMANVTPSHAAEIRRRYEENGVAFEMQSVRGPEVVFAWEPSDPDQEARDVLIGGLTSADDVIQAAAEIAAGVEKEWGVGRTVIEKTFDFDALDLEDERASKILRDIAFARNARLREYGLAQGFELLAEPQRVLQEIAVNMHDEQSVSSITELDVRAAIESGALATDFSVAVVSERFVDITLETRLEDIPDGVPCEACGSPTQKAFIDNQSSGRDVDIRASVPGYQCQDLECGLTAYSIEGFVEALTVGVGILREHGDIATAGAFERRIETERQILLDRQIRADL